MPEAISGKQPHACDRGDFTRNSPSRRSGCLGKRLVSLGNTRQAAAAWRGGRNSLLESAQEATLTSVATAAFPRQCNRLAETAYQPCFHVLRAQNNGLAAASAPAQ